MGIIHKQHHWQVTCYRQF